MVSPKVFRDAVYGDISILPHELLVINTRTYQRLHGIRQLDLGFKVYHDAVHTRFEHLIGATHVVEQIWSRLKNRSQMKVWLQEQSPNYAAEVEALKSSQDDFFENLTLTERDVTRDVVRLSTLMHDITHIPFGHMFENQLRLFQPHDSGHRWKIFLTRLIREIAARYTSERRVIDPYYSAPQVEYLLYLLTRVAHVLVELSGHADVAEHGEEDHYTRSASDGKATKTHVTSDSSGANLKTVSSSKKSDGLSNDYEDETRVAETNSEAARTETTVAKTANANLPAEFNWAIESISSTLDRNLGLPASEMFLADMIGNTICADLLDYIRRDNYFTGLWDRYDDRIFQAFNLARVPNGSRQEVRLSLQIIRKTVRQDTISNILRILELRYDLAEKVIFHHARCAAGAMLSRAFFLSGITSEDESLFYDCSDDQAIQLVRDTAVNRQQNDGVNTDAVDKLISCLMGRDFYKPYYRFLRDADAATASGELQEETVGSKLFGDPRRAQLVLQEIEKVSGLPSGSIILYAPDRKMMLKEALTIVSGDSAENSIPEGMLLREWVEKHLPVRRDHIDAIEKRYAGLWSVTFFVHPDYRAHARILKLITCELLQESYGQAPAQDPVLEELLRHLPSNEEAEQHLKTLREVSVRALGSVVQVPMAAKGTRDPRTDMLQRLGDAINVENPPAKPKRVVDKRQMTLAQENDSDKSK